MRRWGHSIAYIIISYKMIEQAVAAHYEFGLRAPEEQIRNGTVTRPSRRYPTRQQWWSLYFVALLSEVYLRRRENSSARTTLVAHSSVYINVEYPTTLSFQDTVHCQFFGNQPFKFQTIDLSPTFFSSSTL